MRNYIIECIAEFIAPYVVKGLVRPAIAMLIATLFGAGTLLTSLWVVKSILETVWEVLAAIGHFIWGIIVFWWELIKRNVIIIMTILKWIAFIILAAVIGNMLTFDYLVNNDALMTWCLEHAELAITLIQNMTHVFWDMSLSVFQPTPSRSLVVYSPDENIKKSSL
jgi:hypothetical protein